MFINKINMFINRLAGADMAFWILPLLMLNLVLGTLAQHFIGLYESQKIFFASFFYFLGPLPLPGSYTLLGLLAFSLLIKFILHSEWRWNRAGIILAHLGALILLIGGLLTALTTREGFMAIPEGETTPYVYDYNNREFFVFRDEELQHRIAFKNLEGRITLPNFPFVIDVEDRCVNCAITKQDDPKNRKSMARFMQLSDINPEKENEANLSGFTFELTGGDTQDNGTYIAFENMPQPVTLNKNDHTYKLIFGKEQRLLPFSVGLENFTKETYPGTTQARAYSSDLAIYEGSRTFPVRIEMNKPLRYKGYTFYQSSFEQTLGREITILTVVENHGRLFPYIGTLIIAIGLLLHLLIYTRQVKA